MIHLVTFSDDQMSRSRRLCIESALKHGVDSIAGPHYFDPALETRDGFTLEWLKSQRIFQQMGVDWWTQRGIGYWLWKPYIISLLLSSQLADPVTGWRGSLEDGTCIVYADAGVEFIDNIRYIIDRVDQDVFLFGNNWEHAHWCKRDVVDAVWPSNLIEARTLLSAKPVARRVMSSLEAAYEEATWARFGKQAQASVIVIRVSEWSRKFVAEWLHWCLTRKGHRGPCSECDAVSPNAVGYLIDDSPSLVMNHPEFREHRHDQAILTTLAYREGVKLHYWPAMYNDGAFVYEKLPEYAGDDYPVLFHHHRRRDHEWTSAA